MNCRVSGSLRQSSVTHNLKSFRPLLFTAVILLASAAFAGPNGLSHKQLAKLKKLGHVVIPTYIPAHFKLSRIDTEDGSYALEYKGPHKAELTVQMASEGIGDIMVGADSDDRNLKMSSRTVQNSQVGKGFMDVATAKKVHEFGVQWVDFGEKAKPRFLSIIGYNMLPNEGIKVWRGLRFAK